MEIMQLIILALLIEALWETIKMGWQKGKLQTDKVGALIISIGLSVLAGADLFSLVGIALPVPVVGAVLTGVLLSRGSNFLHDLINKINGDNLAA